MESNIAPPAGGNVTTKGLSEIADTFLTWAGNLATTGVSNVYEVGCLNARYMFGLEALQTG